MPRARTASGGMNRREKPGARCYVLGYTRKCGVRVNNDGLACLKLGAEQSRCGEKECEPYVRWVLTAESWVPWVRV